MTVVLEAADLKVTFRKAGTQAVRGVSLSVREGEVLALVGESGSGKSTTGLAVMGLLDRAVTDVEGKVSLLRKNGEQADLATLPERRLRQIRGNDVAMIFQEPMSSLNPIYTIGKQLGEAIAMHRRLSGRETTEECLRLIRQVAIPNPEKCLASYPHQLSGGMRQRVMIAMALSCQPRLLIADEPTTALDVTIQAQIIDVLTGLQRDTGMAVLFITHDLGLVRQIAHRVAVMYAGQIVETGRVADIFEAPRMPYTMGLMRSRPRLGGGGRIEAIPGGVPDLAALPAGCAFHPRCGHYVAGLCDGWVPPLDEVDGHHGVRCLRWREVAS